MLELTALLLLLSGFNKNVQVSGELPERAQVSSANEITLSDVTAQNTALLSKVAENDDHAAVWMTSALPQGQTSWGSPYFFLTPRNGTLKLFRLAPYELALALLASQVGKNIEKCDQIGYGLKLQLSRYIATEARPQNSLECAQSSAKTSAILGTLGLIVYYLNLNPNSVKIVYTTVEIQVSPEQKIAVNLGPLSHALHFGQGLIDVMADAPCAAIKGLGDETKQWFLKFIVRKPICAQDEVNRNLMGPNPDDASKVLAVQPFLSATIQKTIFDILVEYLNATATKAPQDNLISLV